MGLLARNHRNTRITNSFFLVSLLKLKVHMQNVLFLTVAHISTNKSSQCLRHTYN